MYYDSSIDDDIFLANVFKKDVDGFAADSKRVLDAKEQRRK